MKRLVRGLALPLAVALTLAAARPCLRETHGIGTPTPAAAPGRDHAEEHVHGESPETDGHAGHDHGKSGDEDASHGGGAPLAHGHGHPDHAAPGPAAHEGKTSQDTDTAPELHAACHCGCSWSAPAQSAARQASPVGLAIPPGASDPVQIDLPCGFSGLAPSSYDEPDPAPEPIPI